MNKGLKTSLIVLLVAAVGFGVSYLVYQGQLLKNSAFKFLGYRYLGFQNGAFQLQVSVQITNNSEVKMNVANQYYELYIGSKLVGSANSPVPLVLMPNVPVTVQLNAQINPTSTLTGVLNEIKLNAGHEKDSKINLVGTVVGGTDKIAVRIPVNVTFTVTELLS